MPVATVVPSYRTVCILSYNIHNILLASILLLHTSAVGDDFQLLKLGLIPRLRFLIGEPVQEALWSGKVIRARTGGGRSECFEPQPSCSPPPEVDRRNLNTSNSRIALS